MPENRFEAMRIGTVVRDLEAPTKRYEDDFGVSQFDERRVFARFPPEKGSGVHHIAVPTPSKAS